MAVRAVIFDWGGTLTPHADIDLLELWLLVGRHIDPEQEALIAAQLLEVEERFWARTTTTQESGTLDDIIALAAEELGLDVADAVRAEAADLHLGAWDERLSPHDQDAAEVLDELHRQGIRTGLLSNTHWPRQFHEELLARDGLVDRLDARLYTCELSHLKPHPSVFLAALEAVSEGVPGGPIEPADAVLVGDRPRDDIAGAKGVGMKAVLRPNGQVPAGPVEPDAVIGSLTELLAVVERWR
jgi:FMN phosphatase YigB (HAD superfamily)